MYLSSQICNVPRAPPCCFFLLLRVVLDGRTILLEKSSTPQLRRTAATVWGIWRRLRLTRACEEGGEKRARRTDNGCYVSPRQGRVRQLCVANIGCAVGQGARGYCRILVEAPLVFVSLVLGVRLAERCSCSCCFGCNGPAKGRQPTVL